MVLISSMIGPVLAADAAGLLAGCAAGTAGLAFSSGGARGLATGVGVATDAADDAGFARTELGMWRRGPERIASACSELKRNSAAL